MEMLAREQSALALLTGVAQQITVLKTAQQAIAAAANVPLQPSAHAA